MARRKRKSGFDQWVEAFAKLPWKISLFSAPVVGLIFHSMSQIEVPQTTELSQMGGAVFVMAVRTAGLFLQFIIPAALLIAAFLSWQGQRERQNLVAEASRRESSQGVLDLDWRQFESLVAGYFEAQGFAVTQTNGGADGGVDVIAKKEGETFLVQCKQWRATQVGVNVVRELFGVMSACGATGGYVVSAGPFTRPALEFAEGRNIRLIDARKVVAAKGSRQSRSEPVQSPPKCPKCAAAMVQRTARRGANAGKAFWGCSRFPECRGVAAVRPT